MKDIENKLKKDDDFYQEIEQEEHGDHTTSCITLVLFCMIIYAGIVFTSWKISPWFWKVTDRASQIRNNIKIPSSNRAFEDIKNKAKNTLDSTKQNIKNQTQNKVREETNSVIDSAKDQAKNAVQQQSNNIQEELNSVRNE